MPVNLDELYHWGILGQKWGRRRYQYEDGTYTPEGKERRRKEYADMTDDELRTHLNRKRMEREAYQIDQDLQRLNPEKVSAGKQFAKKFLTESVTPAVTAAGRKYLEKLLSENSKIEETELEKLNRESKTWTNKANIERQKNSYYEELEKKKKRERGMQADIPAFMK